jgi:hypothetical protein
MEKKNIKLNRKPIKGNEKAKKDLPNLFVRKKVGVLVVNPAMLDKLEEDGLI